MPTQRKIVTILFSDVVGRRRSASRSTRRAPLTTLGRNDEAALLFEEAASLYDRKGAVTLAAQTRAALDAAGG